MHLPIQVIVLTHSTTLGTTIRTIVATEPPLIRVCAAMTVDHAHTISQGRVPDVVLLDGQLPPPSVGATMAALQSCGWQIRCLVLLPGAEASCLPNHMVQELAGVINRTELAETLLPIILSTAHRTWRHHQTTPGSSRDGMITHTAHVSRQPPLTDRERQVLQLMVTARTNAEIATLLCISEKTVAKHVAGIFGKLGVASRVAAAVHAVRQQLVD